MLFRNLTLFRFPAAQRFDFLEVPLEALALKPVGPLEYASTGFAPPYGQDDGRFVVEHGDCLLFAVDTETKILPAAVVNKELAARLALMERAEGRRPGGRVRKRLKEDVLHELLPKALVRPGRTNAYLDTARSLLVVDTSSRRTAEAVVCEVRTALGSFPALPLNAEVAPRSVMTRWLAEQAMPEQLTLAARCLLRDPADSGARVRMQDQDLASEEVAKHLEAGKQVARLGLVLDDHVEFELSEDLVIRGLRFLDGAMEALESVEREDLRAELDARFALMTGEIGRLFDVLEPELQLSKGEG